MLYLETPYIVTADDYSDYFCREHAHRIVEVDRHLHR